MSPQQQLELGAFETTRPANPVFCHQEFLEKLAQHGRGGVGRRGAFLMQRLAVDARRLHYKPTQGINRGWRRSRLGGNHGSHFYAWWAPKGAAPLKESDEFSSLPDGAVVLRDIRHHDDHTPLAAHSLESHYLPVSVRELRQEEYAPAPWTTAQGRFAAARQPVRILKGHPGSGKTTALWHAADSTGAGRVLYVTYSRDLAVLARDYFDRYCDSQKHFEVITFPSLVRALAGADVAATDLRESRQRFLRDISPFARSLGPWSGAQAALYDEMHAHLAGDAIPIGIGRFEACRGPRVPDRAYRERRARHLGQQAVTAVVETAVRLEKLDSSPLAARYFPELSLAWNALERLMPGAKHGADPALLDFDCIAVDECQDLTPLEALLIIELVSAIKLSRRASIPLLLAGDEAQTVRPTDFEWGWLSDLLHSRIVTPAEHRLAANLRSPRRLAELVNRVWDLYSHIEKQERPSGTGLCEIEDDANDQILYCTGVPGADLAELLIALSAREGLAMITLEESVPNFVPEAARSAVLTPSEAKGLDFHSVCVLDGGRHLERVLNDDARFRAGGDIDGLRKRLAIDQLRVALSRPTERLVWLDINPTDKIVRQSTAFLNGSGGDGAVSSCIPAAVLKAFEEDNLTVEERVQRCQSDARQYLGVKPELSWSRAQQAVALLGRLGSPTAVTDEAARQSAYLTLAEICYALACRNVRLAPELGRPDLFIEAHRAALSAKRYGLAAIISAFSRAQRVAAEERLNALAELAQTLPRHKDELEPWILLEVASKTRFWVEELEAALFDGRNAAVLIRVLPPFYEVLGLSDRGARTARLQQKAIQLLIRDKDYAAGLAALRALPERQIKLEAVCLEGMRDYRGAAACYEEAGLLKEALNCYRSIPDLDAAVKLVRQMGDHPAAESLEWVARLRELVAERPEKFNKIMLAQEKKILEELLERSLGVARRKTTAKPPAAKKTAKPPAPKKRAAARKRRSAAYDDDSPF